MLTARFVEQEMSMVVTQVYLETAQKRALAAHAKKSGRKVAEVIRDAVDAALLGVTTQDLKLLDDASRKAGEHLEAMRSDLAANSKEHRSFMRALEKLRVPN
jgi:predicted RNA-binding protein